MMGDKNNKIPQDELVENQSPINFFESMERDEEEIKDLNFSYSDTSSDGGGLSSPFLGMIKVLRIRRYIKGQGWTLVVVHPKPKVEEIKELIGEIQDKQGKHTLPLSGIHKGESSSSPRKKLQWVPKKQSFQAQVKEKLRKNKNKVRKPKENPI